MYIMLNLAHCPSAMVSGGVQEGQKKQEEGKDDQASRRAYQKGSGKVCEAFHQLPLLQHDEAWQGVTATHTTLSSLRTSLSLAVERG